ncbi:site-specific tyrosine recombinase XerD [compost metagenome]
MGEGKIKRLTFNEIDSKFIGRFNKYLTTDLKMLNNTVAKNMKTLRTFLNFCSNPQRQYYTPYEPIKFQVKENEPAIIALKESEVEHLYDFKFESEKLQSVRDVFVFGCYTGLRYSDLKKIKKTSIEGDFIKFNISKSQGTEEQTVPLLPIAKEILNKYKDLSIDQALPVLSNQKMNDYIKDMCKEAKIDQIITITELQSGKKMDKEFRKYELVTCHTCRKTFISMLINKGVPEAIIKSITGHIKDSKAFVRYYQIDNDEKLQGISKAFNL